MGYRMSSYRKRVGRRRHYPKKRKGSSGGFGSAGDASYVSLSGQGARRKFLGAVEKALATKAVYDNVSSLRHVSLVNQMGYSYHSLCFTDEIKNAFFACTGATPNEGGRVYIEYVTARMQIVNQVNVPASIWIYEACLRKDTNDALQPNTDLLAGIQAEGGSATDYLLPYTTPFKSSRFCAKWKIKRCTKILLAPGEEHVHTVRLNVYGYVAQQRLYDANSSVATALFGVGGLSHLIMVATLGGVINDNTTTTNVGFAATAIDIAMAKMYRVSALYDDKHKYAKTSTLPTITTGSTMVEVDADPSAIVTA